jgi:tetratricopeptide (TPR) repeat protein
MVTLARDHYRSRRLDLALYALKGILDGYGEENPPRDKNNAEARLIRGLIYKEQGLRGPAIQELQKALELRPDLVEARVQLSSYYLESGNAADAQQMLEPALKYDADNVIAHLNLGDAYRLLGRPADAKREFEWVKKRDPSVAQVHYNLGLLYLFTENFPGVTPGQAADTAIDELNQYKKMKPRVAGGTPDDTDELITRAKTKKALLDAKAAEAADAAAAPPAAAPPGDAAATPPAAAPAAKTTTTPSATFAPAAGANK